MGESEKEREKKEELKRQRNSIKVIRFLQRKLILIGINSWQIYYRRQAVAVFVDVVN